MPTSPPLFLLDRLVRTGGDIKFQGRVLTSEDKQAIGFEEQEEADAVMRNLVLGADLDGLPACSSLILQGGGRFSCIHTVDKDLIVIVAEFLGYHYHYVYLIYNAIDRSLRMIPTEFIPDPPIRTDYVLVAREDDEDRSYALVLPGTDLEGDAALFLWLSSSSDSPWTTAKKANFPSQWLSDTASPFLAQQVFSFRGRGYGVDLLCGAMYCECSDVLSQDITPVDVKSILLPVGCQEYLGSKADIVDPRGFRAMAPSGDSIRFVSIDGYLEPVDLKDCKVRVWRLIMEDMSWAVEYELKLASLWSEVEFKGNSTVPDWLAPKHPLLSTHEDHVIYFALGSSRRRGDVFSPYKYNPCCMVRVDLRSKTFNCTDLTEEARNIIGDGVHVPLYSNIMDEAQEDNRDS